MPILKIGTKSRGSFLGNSRVFLVPNHLPPFCRCGAWVYKPRRSEAPARTVRGGETSENTGREIPERQNMTTKKKPAAPAKKQGAKKPAAPTAKANKLTGKPAPLSELEQEARALALRGIRSLRETYWLGESGEYDGAGEDSELKHAGAWGKAYAKVCEALEEAWDFAWFGGGAFAEADAAVGVLEGKEERAKREARNARRKVRLAIAKAGFHPTSTAAALVRAGIMPA